MENILKQHGIETKHESGKLFALECYTLNGKLFTVWTDTSAWQTFDLLNFLGY